MPPNPHTIEGAAQGLSGACTSRLRGRGPWGACWRFWKGGCHADAALLGPDLQAAEPVDRRRGFDGLAAATRSLLGDPLRGHLFCFLNQRRNRIKVLVGDRNRLRAFVPEAGARDVCPPDAADPWARSGGGRRGRVWIDAGRSGSARGAAPPPWVPEPSPGTPGVRRPLTP
jgi:hypothetical protein